jgi:hypothetical protein
MEPEGVAVVVSFQFDQYQHTDLKFAACFNNDGDNDSNGGQAYWILSFII